MGGGTASGELGGFREALFTREVVANFNDEVLVKVTPLGERIWEEYHAEIRTAMRKPNAFKLERDEEGYTKLQLHEVANIFGPAMTLGMHPPLETEFKFVPKQH